MKTISQILGARPDQLIQLIINWTEITGVSNRELMIPVEIKENTLTIAVPNGMVAKSFARFKYQIILNINKVLKNAIVSDIRFKIDPSRFSGETPEPVTSINNSTELSKEEITAKRREIEARGISPELSEKMAVIELFWQKKKTQ